MSILITFAYPISTTSGEFYTWLYEEVKCKEWHPVQVSLPWSVCVVVCTTTWTPGYSDHLNNQKFIEDSTGTTDRIVN